MNQITTVTSKGQVTIPLTFRELLGIQPGQKIEFFTKRKTRELVLRPVPSLLDLKGYLKTNKKYNKKAARKAFIKDVVVGKI